LSDLAAPARYAPGVEVLQFVESDVAVRSMDENPQTIGDHPATLS
jgi:hypothetical protein